MKLLQILFSASLLVLYFPHKAQQVQSTCLGSTIALQQCYESSDQLTHRNTFLNNATYKDSVWLNPTTRTRYLRALTAVYNATMLTSRDSIYFVTAFMPELRTVILRADSNLSWVKNLVQKNTPTGNSQMDYLIAKYKLKMDGYYPLPAFSCTTCLTVSLKSDTSINTTALSTIINQIPTVFNSQINGFVGDGQDIIDTVYANYIDLTYYLGWGDCLAGCIHKRYWKFKVYDDCKVEFVKSYGGPPPPWLLAGIESKIATSYKINVFPNPVTDKLQIKTADSSPLNLHLTINNNLGQIVFEKEVQSNQEIDLSFLPSGIYYVKVKSELGPKIFKIVKE